MVLDEAAAAAKAAGAVTQAADKLLNGETVKAPRFGLGKPSVESKCERVHVFIRAIGRFGEARRRVILPPERTVQHAIDEFAKEHGGPPSQSVLTDEHGFALPARAREWPLSELSSGCGLSLALDYETGLLHEAGKQTASGAGEVSKRVSGLFS